MAETRCPEGCCPKQRSVHLRSSAPANKVRTRQAGNKLPCAALATSECLRHDDYGYATSIRQSPRSAAAPLRAAQDYSCKLRISAHFLLTFRQSVHTLALLALPLMEVPYGR